ncbi:MAG: hypothetical protein FWF02_03945 [Micrococcales bacterium]|nr:hypothetical protein [Micrococcales bacterium]MCL2666842.1 hypothetical protein [Micrococcales bacterium]
MRWDPEVVAAASLVMRGDDSRDAAARLERAIHAHHLHEEALDDLLETLALYQPGAGAPYANYEQLLKSIHRSGIVPDSTTT